MWDKELCIQITYNTPSGAAPFLPVIGPFQPWVSVKKKKKWTNTNHQFPYVINQLQTISKPHFEQIFCLPSYERKRLRHKNTLFMQSVQHLLGDIKGMLKPNHIALIWQAQNRSPWRTLLVICSVADIWWCFYEFLFLLTQHLNVLNFVTKIHNIREERHCPIGLTTQFLHFGR